MYRAMRARRFGVVGFLQVIWEYQRGNPATALGYAHSPIHHVSYLCRRAGLTDELTSHVLEHGREVDFLLVVPTDRGTRLLTRNRQHRHVVHARVIQSRDQVGRSWSRRRHADTNFAGE